MWSPLKSSVVLSSYLIVLIDTAQPSYRAWGPSYVMPWAINISLTNH
jgi:hypothetical protein